MPPTIKADKVEGDAVEDFEIVSGMPGTGGI